MTYDSRWDAMRLPEIYSGHPHGRLIVRALEEVFHGEDSLSYLLVAAGVRQRVSELVVDLYSPYPPEVTASVDWRLASDALVQFERAQHWRNWPPLYSTFITVVDHVTHWTRRYCVQASRLLRIPLTADCGAFGRRCEELHAHLGPMQMANSYVDAAIEAEPQSLTAAQLIQMQSDQAVAEWEQRQQQQ